MDQITYVRQHTVIAAIDESRRSAMRGDFKSPERGMVILMEEVGEASQRVLELGRGSNPMRHHTVEDAYMELIQVAAVAMRLADQIREDRWPTRLS